MLQIVWLWLYGLIASQITSAYPNTSLCSSLPLCLNQTKNVSMSINQKKKLTITKRKKNESKKMKGWQKQKVNKAKTRDRDLLRERSFRSFYFCTFLFGYYCWLTSTVWSTLYLHMHSGTWHVQKLSYVAVYLHIICNFYIYMLYITQRS